MENNPFGWQWMDSSHPSNTEGSCMWLMCILCHKLAHVSRRARGSSQTSDTVRWLQTLKGELEMRVFWRGRKKRIEFDLWHFHTISPARGTCSYLIRICGGCRFTLCIFIKEQRLSNLFFDQLLITVAENFTSWWKTEGAAAKHTHSQDAACAAGVIYQ